MVYVQAGQTDLSVPQELDDLDTKVDKLRTTFEMYFQGIERRPPNLERDAIKRRIQNLRRMQLRNTALKFRINQLVAKMTTYESYWDRTLKQIEEGTYRRDVFKAKHRSKAREEMENSSATEQAAEESAQRQARRKPGNKSGLTDDKVDAIYNAYRTAKQRCKEKVTGISRDKLASTLNKQVPSIMKQYKCKSVEFKVVIKGGKAILKAVPKF